MAGAMTSAHRRSPVVVYLLQWATSGAYTLWWLHRTMRDLNAMVGRDIFSLRMTLAIGRSILYSFFLLFGLLLFLGPRLVDYLPTTILVSMGVLMFALAVAWNGGLAYVHVRIARAIADLYDEQALPGKPSPALAVVLFFAGFAALPYLQAKMNRIVPAKSGHNADVERPNDT